MRKKIAPDVIAEIAITDAAVAGFGAISAELNEFAGEVAKQIREAFPDLTDSARFRLAAYQMHVLCDLASVTDHPSAYSTAAGYMVAAYMLAGPLRG